MLGKNYGDRLGRSPKTTRFSLDLDAQHIIAIKLARDRGKCGLRRFQCSKWGSVSSRIFSLRFGKITTRPVSTYGVSREGLTKDLR